MVTVRVEDMDGDLGPGRRSVDLTESDSRENWKRLPGETQRSNHVVEEGFRLGEGRQMIKIVHCIVLDRKWP